MGYGFGHRGAVTHIPDPKSHIPKALAITGPTASGKTSLSIALAKAVNGSVISMDSRQVYRGMDIGTAKASAAERAQVTHYGLDLVDPNERYSAGRFASDARRWIETIRARGQVPVLVGGTGFFLKALTDPMFAEPELPASREALKSYLQHQSAEELLRWLGQLDPRAAERLSVQGGRQRMMRALEVVLLTGRTLGWWHEQSPPIHDPVNVLTFALELPRDELYRRINHRVHAMVENGLVEEVSRLVARGFDDRAPGMNATGYIEMLPYLRGEYDLATAIDAIQRATRRYARRQMTWFRHQLPAGTTWLDARQPLDELVGRILEVCDG